MLHYEVKANLDRIVNGIYVVVDTLLQQGKTPDICNGIWASSRYQSTILSEMNLYTKSQYRINTSEWLLFFRNMFIYLFLALLQSPWHIP